MLPVTPDTTAPTAPATATATPVSPTRINVAWTASSDDGALFGYHLERCQGAGCSNFAQIVTTGATSHSDEGLAAATSYSYRVRAVDASGNLSGYSPVATATTPPPLDTTPPTPPTGLSATATGSTSIALSWTASTDNVGVTGYEVERCTGAVCSTFALVATPTATSYSDTGLTARTRYRYRVRAVDDAGNRSAYSSIATAMTTR